MGSKQTFAIVHANDIDGIGSAALIRKALGTPLENIFFNNYTSSSLDYIVKSVLQLAEPKCTIVVADLSVNDSQIERYIQFLRVAKAKGCKAIWLDHHPWSTSAIEKVANMCDVAIVGENKGNCAVDIVKKEFNLNDSISARIREIAHTSDFKLRCGGSIKSAVDAYGLAIAYYNMLPQHTMYSKLRSVVSSICNGRIPGKEVISDAKYFKKMNAARIRKMLSDIRTFGVFAVGFSEPVVANDACDAILKKSGKPVAVFVNTETGKVHMRSASIDLVPIASAAGGGGHPYAAGFSVDIKKYGSFKKESQKALFIKKLKSYFASAP